jgi:glycosyltransferase involved in cell wall biosynthesis
MRVLFVTNDYIGEKRAGPAIRMLELARVVAEFHEVTVASAQPSTLDLGKINLISGARSDPGALRAAVDASDIVVTQGVTLLAFPFLRRAKFLVIELYDPYLFEYLEHAPARFPRWGYLRHWYLLNRQMELGDFFICANERQWDYWIGRFCALGRLTPEMYKLDPTFGRLLAVIPFGISSTPPVHTRPVVKGVVPGISADDILLLWAGGIWQWFDPLTLIRAMHQVSSRRSDVKLLFPGTRHPSLQMPQMPMAETAQKLAQELGVLNRSVFFQEGWVPKADLQNYLLEADIGVSTYWDVVETRFAFRTRVCEYIWAGLPMILTRGDYFADLVERHCLGKTVAGGDVTGWTEAILDLAASREVREGCGARVRALAPKLYWERVAEPLLDFCRQPYHTPKPPPRRRLVPAFTWGYQYVHTALGKLRRS